MGRVLLDLRCDVCEYIQEDEYDHGGKGDYGPCPECTESIRILVQDGVIYKDECTPGTMRQIFSTGGFTLGTIANMSGTTGRTSNGTKYEVVGRPRRYDYRTKKFGGEVM